jgi:hypothetical protein
MPVGHRLHQNARPKRHVAAGKYARSSSVQVAVNLQNSARRHLHAVLFVQIREIRLLPDSQNHAVAGDDLLFFAEGGIEASVLVEHREAAPHLQPRDNAVLADNFLRPPAVVEHDAFVLRLVHFDLPGRHLLARLQAHHVHLFGAGAHRQPRRIERRLQALVFV